MPNKDTINLLKECDSGTKMAVSSIDEILEQVQDHRMIQLLSENKKQHETIGNELHGMLLASGSEEKDPTPIAKGMSWVKTNFKLNMDNSDATIADLITDGCNMGIKSLRRYLNQYAAATEESKEMCHNIILLEEQLRKELQAYL